MKAEIIIRQIVFILFLSVNIFSLKVEAQNQKQDYFLFDFGSQKSRLSKYSIPIDSSCTYSKEKGFGLLSGNLASYNDPSLGEITNSTICDGLISKDSIEFRIDLPPGDYIIEILMHGGERTLWEGSIVINDTEILDRILSYSASYEGQSPPPYWGITRPFKNEGSYLRFKIRAEQQPTMVSGISIYSGNFGPVENIDGKAVAARKLQSPNGDFCIELINEAKISEAKKIIDAIPPYFRFEKALLLFALSSRIEVENPRDYIETAFYYLRDESEINPRSEVLLNLRFAELILNANHFQNIAGWMWNKDIYPQSGFFNYVNIAGDSYEEASAIPEHPLFLAATWMKAKTAYWIYIEQHEKELIELADKYFNLLKEYFPNNDLLDEYLGIMKYDVNDELKPEEIPEWAFLQNKIVSSMLEIIHYWVETRQAENGEFGGKYDDDVEMLRWWPISRLAFEDPIALKGMKRIVDGIWKSDWIEKGFSKNVRDVEHSSEPVADTQPMMIGLDYGNPIYVERCMESVKGIRDLWTGINSRGHRHFKSSWYSATQIDTVAPKDCDLEMNTRTVKAALWLAWYNRHPFVLQFLKEWSDSWLEDCLRTDKGKPKGVVPAAIRFYDDAIGGHSENWHHPEMFWDYFNYRGGAMMLTQFLITSILLNEDKYLEPIELSLELILKYEGIDLSEAPLGSEEYAANIMSGSNNFWEVIELWRLYKNNNKYDGLIRKKGSPYIKYYLTKNETDLNDEMKTIVNKIKNNFTLNTSEGYFTDRIDLGDMRKQDSKTGSLLETMYLGSSLTEAEFPFNRITWKGFDKNFSALVLVGSNTEIKLKTFLHPTTNTSGEIVFLDFEPGEYEIRIGRDLDGDLKLDGDISKHSFLINGRNSGTSVNLLAGAEQIIEVELIKKEKKASVYELIDLAITNEELTINKNGKNYEVVIPVHNVGIKDAKNVIASLILKENNSTRTIRTIENILIKAPLDLEAKKEVVKFNFPGIPGNYRIEIGTKGNEKEITDLNNSLDFEIR